MPKISNQIIIQVTEFTVNQGRRRFSISLDIDADIFADEGHLKDFKSTIHIALRKAITDYIEESRGLLKKIITSLKEQQTTTAK